MKLIVPTNWQEDLLGSIRLDSVAELYGKANSDTIGGGRGSCVIPDPSRLIIENQIKQIVSRKIGFNYLLNATCLGDRAATSTGVKEIEGLLGWLVSCGVTSVTVSSPSLLKFIKRAYPSLRVCVSTQVGVRNWQSAAQWEAWGADAITLSFVDVNRDFKSLRRIRAAVRCDLQVIANLDCLYGCPYFRYHAHVTSHASQSGHPSRGFVIDYCFLKCNTVRFRDPVEFLRSGWIRPEDIHYYESAGINALKLVNRTMPTHKLRLVVDAYTRGTYEGNLLDLFSDPSRSVGYKKFRNFKFYLRPDAVNILKLWRFRGLFAPRKIFIDNTVLDGFLDYFQDSDCSSRDCRKCGYCASWADKVIRFDPVYRDMMLRALEKNLNSLVTGEIFS